MKIEIGESLVYSWLRHIKSCQIVQLNWKASTVAWDLYKEDIVENIYNKIHNHFSGRGYNIFKNSYSQLLQQGEIDALGVALDKNIKSSFYGVDIAFHENGLKYGKKKESCERIVKKMVRTAMLFLAFFNSKKASIVFASPKIGKSLVDELNNLFNELNELFSNMGFEYTFELYANERFQTSIFLPVIKCSDKIADTSELFMRSIQMYNLFQNKKIAGKKRNAIVNSSKSQALENIKIGFLVQMKIAECFKAQQITDDELNNLCDLDYSKRTFGMQYPILKKVDPNSRLDDQRKVKDFFRYYSTPFSTGKKSFLLCNCWYEKNRKNFLEWLKNYNH